MVLGFSVIWGVMGVINLAHGEYLMIGAYLAWIFSNSFGMDPFASLILIMPIMFVVGYLIQRLLINRIVERPHLMALLVTFWAGHLYCKCGLKSSIPPIRVTLILVMVAPRRLGDSLFRLSKASSLSPHSLLCSPWRFSCSGPGWASRFGLRPKTRRPRALWASKIDQVYAITAGICIALTAAAGAMISLTVPVFPFMGPPFTLKAFTITALGGLGRIPGALLGGLVLGIVESMVARFVPGVGTNLGVATSFVLLVVVLIRAPTRHFAGTTPHQC